MRRILLMFVAAALMAATMAFSAAPAFACHQGTPHGSVTTCDPTTTPGTGGTVNTGGNGGTGGAGGNGGSVDLAGHACQGHNNCGSIDAGDGGSGGAGGAGGDVTV